MRKVVDLIDQRNAVAHQYIIYMNILVSCYRILYDVCEYVTVVFFIAFLGKCIMSSHCTR